MDLQFSLFRSFLSLNVALVTCPVFLSGHNSKWSQAPQDQQYLPMNFHFGFWGCACCGIGGIFGGYGDGCHPLYLIGIWCGGTYGCGFCCYSRTSCWVILSTWSTRWSMTGLCWSWSASGIEASSDGWLSVCSTDYMLLITFWEINWPYHPGSMLHLLIVPLSVSYSFGLLRSGLWSLSKAFDWMFFHPTFWTTWKSFRVLKHGMF